MFKIFILASDEYFDNLWVDFDEIEANSTVQIMSQMNLNKSELIKYQYQRIYDQGKSTFHLYKNPKLKKPSRPRDFSTQILPTHQNRPMILIRDFLRLPKNSQKSYELPKHPKTTSEPPVDLVLKPP